jgi:hypothetical protein
MNDARCNFCFRTKTENQVTRMGFEGAVIICDDCFELRLRRLTADLVGWYLLTRNVGFDDAETLCDPDWAGVWED